MPKVSQALILDPPNELRFQGPISCETGIKARLELSNPNEHPVAFKVSTNANKRYVVRPNGGIIAPRHSKALLVLLRPSAEDNFSKDKLQVVSMVWEDGPIPSATLFQRFRETSPDLFVYSKIRCVFDPLMPGQEQKAPQGNEATKKAPLSDSTSISEDSVAQTDGQPLEDYVKKLVAEELSNNRTPASNAAEPSSDAENQVDMLREAVTLCVSKFAEEIEALKKELEAMKLSMEAKYEQMEGQLKSLASKVAESATQPVGAQPSAAIIAELESLLKRLKG